jgi:hypothetical protein
MLAAIRAFVKRKTDKWLFQLRDAEPGEVLLNQRRVFILPTGAGMGFAAMLVVLLIGATNYNLGLGFALTFALAICAVVDMYFTYRNLVELSLQPGRSQPVFAGEDAHFELAIVNRTRRDRFALRVDFLQVGEARYVTDAPAGASAPLLLSAPSSARGWLKAPRATGSPTPRPWSTPFPKRTRRRCRCRARPVKMATATPAMTTLPVCAATSRATPCATWPGARSPASIPNWAGTW